MHWNSKISQIPTKDGFIEKKIGIFLKIKTYFFTKFGKGGEFVVECMSNEIIS